MTKLEEFCKELRWFADEYSTRGVALVTFCRKVQAAVEMLEHVYDAARDDWPEMRETLDMFAAKAMEPKR